MVLPRLLVDLLLNAVTRERTSSPLLDTLPASILLPSSCQPRGSHLGTAGSAAVSYTTGTATSPDCSLLAPRSLQLRGAQSGEPNCFQGSWISAVSLFSVGICPGQHSPDVFANVARRDGASSLLHWFHSPQGGVSACYQMHRWTRLFWVLGTGCWIPQQP